MYAAREHFIKKLSVALMAWGAVDLILASSLPAADFRWYLRPHHVAEDFQGLVDFLRTAFHALTSAHDCPLFSTLRCCILDGKWSIQTPVCNERGSGFEWNAGLQVGYFRGCTLRPQPGAKFCKMHDEHCCVAIEDTSIQSHREVQASGTGRLEYLVGDTWKHANEVPVSHVRAYELGLLRSRQRKELLAEADSCRGLSFLNFAFAPSCGARHVSPCHSILFRLLATGNQDDRKGVQETIVSRKSHGILVAVSPCLHIISIRPMFASESLVQVFMMVHKLVSMLPDLSHVIYDNACGAARSLRKRASQATAVPSWAALNRLKWVIDRLHLRYHTACRQPGSGWHVEGVDPADHPELRGIDTEAAEQVFHIANKWQAVLTLSSPVHQEIFLYLFARDHNKRHGCRHAWQAYRAAQSSRVAAAGGPPIPSSSASPGECSVPPRVRKRKVVAAPSCAGLVELEAADLPAAAAFSESQPAPLVLAVAAARDAVVINTSSDTVHAIGLTSDVYTHCGWSFQMKPSKTIVAAAVPQDGFYSCGTCYGQRVPFWKPGG